MVGLGPSEGAARKVCEEPALDCAIGDLATGRGRRSTCTRRCDWQIDQGAGVKRAVNNGFGHVQMLRAFIEITAFGLGSVFPVIAKFLTVLALLQLRAVLGRTRAT